MMLSIWRVEFHQSAIANIFEKARQLVLETDGINQTRALAEDYAEKAIQSLSDFPDSEAKDGLVEMAVKTIKRRK